jgi:phosphate starvation-inducible PhoH-like protein
LGSAGSGKTFISTAYSVYSFLRKETQKITITRPIVEAGERLGFLPGSFEDKVHPYMLPIYDTLDELVGTEGPQRMALNKSLEVAPLAYLRGRTFKHSVCILDEAQNCTENQLELILGRLCNGSKIIICGDSAQVDLKYKKDSGFDFICKHMKDIVGFSIISLQTNHRHPIVEDILKVFDAYRN